MTKKEYINQLFQLIKNGFNNRVSDSDFKNDLESFIDVLEPKDRNIFSKWGYPDVQVSPDKCWDLQTKKEIELHKVYDAIKEIITKEKIESKGVVDYCQSWWLNYKNNGLGKEMNTPKINRLAKILVEGGYLIIDKSKTSTSTGTCYKLTDKQF